MRPICLLLTGEPVPVTRQLRGGFSALIREASRTQWPGGWLDVDCRGSDPLPDPTQTAGIIISGSPASVTSHEPWMERAGEFLRRAAGASVPTLGICFGHQLLAQALGGEVVKNPRGREIGTVQLQLLQEDPVLDASQQPFWVNMTHVDSVSELPPGARALARTQLDPHAAVRFGEKMWGVQYHPEVDGEVMIHYLNARRELLISEGLDPDALRARAVDAEPGRASLERFIECAVAGS